MWKSGIKVGSFFLKVFSVLCFVALIFVLISVFKETYKKNQIQKEINNLQDEAQKINKENSEIRERIAYFESPEYQEKEAKDKLGLQNPDEKVIVVTPSAQNVAGENISTINVGASKFITQKELPTYQKWWNYFFEY